MQEKKGEAFLSPEIAKLSEKLQKDPSSKFFFPLAEEYIKCNMLEEAIMVLTDGLKTHPGFHAARVSLGKRYLQKGRVAEAKAEFEKVVVQNPDNLMAQKKLAQIYRDEGNIQKARQICENILLTNAKDLEMKKLLTELEKPLVKPAENAISQIPTVKPSTSQAISEVASQISENLKGITPSLNQVPTASVEAQAPSISLEGYYQGGTSEDKAGTSAQVPQQPSPSLAEPQPEARLHDQGRESGKMPPPIGKEQEDEERIPDEVEERKIPVIELDLDEAVQGFNNEEDIFSELLGPSSAKPQSTATQGPAPAPPVAFAFTGQENHQALPETTQDFGGGEGDEKDAPAMGAVELARSPEPTVPQGPPEENVEESSGLEGGLATATLAEFYVKQGHYEQGIEIYRKILDHDPYNEEVRQRLEDALALANLLTKRPKEIRPSSPDSRIPEVPPPASKSDQPVRSTPEQLRQAKVERLQAWLEQLKRSQNT